MAGPRSYSKSKFFKRLQTGYGIDIEFLGNWDNVLKYLKTLPMPVYMAAQQGQALVAKRFAKEVCNSIRMGYVEGPSEKHYKSKDSRLLINTRLYLESIRAYKEGKIWRVGIQPGYKTQHKGSNIELRSLAEIHEFGLRSRRIPARPVWFPTYQRLGGVQAFRKPIWDLMVKAVKRSKPKEVRISYGKLF